jgi:DNA-damage-inducible protein J
MPKFNLQIATPELKEQAETLFSQIGMNMTTAINVFLKASVRAGRIPFDLIGDDEVLRREIRGKLAEAQEYAQRPDALRMDKDEFFAKVRTEPIEPGE